MLRTLQTQQADLSPVFDGATDGVPVHPPDLSTRGMFINTPHDLRLGSMLNLHFRLALSEAEVTLRARVPHRKGELREAL